MNKIKKEDNSDKYKFQGKYYSLYELVNEFLKEENFELAQEHIEKEYIDKYLDDILEYALQYKIEKQNTPLKKLFYLVYSTSDLDFILYGKVITKDYIKKLISKKKQNCLNEIEEKIFKIIFNKEFLDLVTIYEELTYTNTDLKNFIQIDDKNLAKEYLSFVDFDYLREIFQNKFEFILDKNLKGHNDTIYSIAISSEDEFIVSASMDKTIKIWDFNTGKCLKTLEGHTSAVESIAISCCDEYIVSGSWDKTIKIWDVKTGKCLKTLKGHNDYILSIAISNEDEFIISGSRDGTIKIWDFETGECLKTIEDEWEASVTLVAITDDNEYIISGNSFGKITIWDVENEYSLETLEDLYEDSIISINFINDDKYIVATNIKTINIWSMLNLENIGIKKRSPLQTISTESDFDINSSTITNDDKYIIYGNDDGTINICDMENGEHLDRFEENRVNRVAVSNYNRYIIVSGNRDGEIKIWKNNSNVAYIEKNIKLLEFNIAMKFIEEEIINLDNVIRNLLEIGDFEYLEKMVDYFNESSKYKEKFIDKINRLNTILIVG
jgi:WD40 repeat protein